MTSITVETDSAIETLTFENEATLDEVERQQRSILPVDGDSNSESTSSDGPKPSNTSDEAEEINSGATRREVTLRRKKKRQRDQRLQEPCQCKLNLKSQTKCKKMEGNTQIMDLTYSGVTTFNHPRDSQCDEVSGALYNTEPEARHLHPLIASKESSDSEDGDDCNAKFINNVNVAKSHGYADIEKMKYWE